MTKKKNKKPTIDDLAQFVGKMDLGLKGLVSVLKMYVEFKGDTIAFNQFLDGKAKEHEEMKKQEQQAKENGGNTD